MAAVCSSSSYYSVVGFVPLPYTKCPHPRCNFAYDCCSDKTSTFADARKLSSGRNLTSAGSLSCDNGARNQSRAYTREHSQDAAVASCSDWASRGSVVFGGDSGRSRKSWNAAGMVLSSRAKSGRRGRCGATIKASAQDEAATVKAIADLSESLLSLKGIVNGEYRAIGPEMRGRVDRLFDRVFVLRQSADRTIKSGSRIPSQLTANLIALQREHGSLENIVRLAREAAPGLETLEAAVTRPSQLSAATSNLQYEDVKPQASVFQSLIRESSLEPVKKPSPKYVMSAPASQGSSPLAAFRAEIERRVIEQLSGKKTNTPASSTVAVAVTESSNSTALPSIKPQDKIQGAEEVPTMLQLKNELKVEELQRPGDADVPRSVALAEEKVKQVELELAKSIPLRVYEQKVGRINSALTEARAQVVQLNSELLEKETMLATVKKDMLAEQKHLVQKVQELTGDLDKMYSVDELEAAINHGLAEAERELEEEQDRNFLLKIELDKKEKFIVEQQEKWRIEKEAMEKQMKIEQERALSLGVELDGKEKLILEQKEQWQEQKAGLVSDLKSIQVKLQDIRKRRTKERAQLAEKKQKVKMLQQELARVQESMQEADRIRLKKKEATYATVRTLITHMVQSSRARAESDARAVTLGEEVAKLQEDKEALKLNVSAAEEKANQAESTIEGIKSSLASAGREVDNLEGELHLQERAAALERFFAIMGRMIKQESENLKESLLETDDSLESDLAEDVGVPEIFNGTPETAGYESDDEEPAVMEPVKVQNETDGV